MTTTTSDSAPEASPPSENGDPAEQSEQRQAPTKTYPIGGEVLRAAKSAWWRNQKGLYPVACGVGLAVAGSGLHDHHASPLLGAAIPAGVFLASLTQEKVRAWLAKEPWRRTWAAGCLAAAAAWTSTATATGAGMDTLMPSVLVVGGSLLSAPWWFANRWVPRRRWEAPARTSGQAADSEEAAEQAAVSAAPKRAAMESGPEHLAIEPPPHPHQIRWDSTLAQQELKNTRLEQREQIVDHLGDPNGSAWIINGTDARLSWQTMFRALSAIYASYDRPGVDKLVHLEREKERWETRARLVILERDPLLQTIEWVRPGLDPATGKIPFAVYPDGSGWAPYTLYVPGWGTPHDQVIGETGSGKGGGLRVIAIETLAAGNRLVLFDPHGNGALEDVTGLVRTPLVTPRQMLAGMAGVEAVLEERIRMRSEVGKHRFEEAIDHKILHVMVDETTQVLGLDREIARILGRVYREGRKFWVKGSLADQSTAFGDQLGHSGAVIRDQAQGGTTVLYRTSPTEARRTNPGVDLPVPPHKLPEWIDEDAGIRFTGLGYVIGSTKRVLKSRTQWVPDAMFAAWCPPIDEQVLDERCEEVFQQAFEAAMNGSADTASRKKPEATQRDNERPSNVTALYSSAPDDDERASQLLLEFLHQCGGRATRAQISDARICPAAQAHRLLSAMKGNQITEVSHGEYEVRAS
jgi:hypothetical protein